MSRISITSQTPCPAPAALDPSHRRISSFELFADDTAQVDFTRAFDQPLTGIKPRRRSMMCGPARKKVAPVTIFEDVSEEPETTVEEVKKPLNGTNRRAYRSTLLSRPPAKRPQGTAGISISMAGLRVQDDRSGPSERGVGTQKHISAGGRISIGGFGSMRTEPSSEPGRLVSLGGARLQPGPVAHNLATRTDGGSSVPAVGATVRKPSRRQTIFVPEDTTVLTIHPGARDNTYRIDDTFNLPLLANEQSAQDENRFVTNTRPLRKSRPSLCVAPKRLPLRETLSTENMPGRDVAGANTGKENMPPVGQVHAQKVGKSFAANIAAEVRTAPRNLYAPTQASRNRQSIVPRANSQLTTTLPRPPTGVRVHEGPKNMPRKTIQFGPINESPVPVENVAPAQKHASVLDFPATSKSCSRESNAASKVDDEQQRIRQFVASKRNERQMAKLQQYPVLEGNLCQPALYEDKWLSYQEVALTEVINGIFQSTMPTSEARSCQDHKALKAQLIDLYNRPLVAMLHGRLQASLKYGALAHPQSTVSVHQPTQDLGLRKRLMKMWLDTYDHRLLMEAAQVVAGRQIPQSADASPGATLDLRAGKRGLTAFLEDFFVCVVDVDADPYAIGDESLDTLRWQKTMLRSFMLVWLLDQSAEADIMNGSCLMSQKSEIKTTEATLQLLGRYMLPACGDIMRTLKHLQYNVHYHQDPLDEVIYHVENIATDFRDGVFLTHLVELLVLDQSAIKGADKTLSTCLKIPCEKFTQRAYNVQIALNALQGHSIQSANIVGDVTADDIVAGHRERTLSLLWSLASNYGLSHLVEWKNLVADIQRVSGCNLLDSSPEIVAPVDQEHLLQQWAAAYAAQAGLSVENLSTSFADGKVYAVIASAFVERFHMTPEQPDLQGQLRAFGCSQAFSEKIAMSVGVVVGKETVVSNLAFLASRLLALVQ